MYERTSLCPYKDICESYLSITNIEKKLHNLRRTIATRTLDSTSNLNYEESTEEIRQKLIKLNRARERCQSRYKRCLRYWSLKNEHDSGKLVRTSDKIYSPITIPE
jgi:hypothetical protein